MPGSTLEALPFESRTTKDKVKGPRYKDLGPFTWLGLGDGNITFSDELDFDPSELDIVYRGDSTEDER